MAEYATVYHRDVCNEGFGLENVADAVFLDLPSPWKTLVSAKTALKKQGGRICSFSPCIEQVQKVVLELSHLGFTDIYTIESLRRVLCVKKYAIPEFDFEHDVRDHKRTNEANKNDVVVEEDEESIEIKTEPIETDRKTKIKIDFKRNNKNRKMRKRDTKRKNGRDEAVDSNDDSNNDDSDEDAGPAVSQYAAKAINMQPGHTGFLTFATLLHKDYQKL